ASAPMPAVSAAAASGSTSMPRAPSQPTTEPTTMGTTVRIRDRMKSVMLGGLLDLGQTGRRVVPVGARDRPALPGGQRRGDAEAARTQRGNGLAVLEVGAQEQVAGLELDLHVHAFTRALPGRRLTMRGVEHLRVHRAAV